MNVICHTQEHFHAACNFCNVYSDAQFRSDIQLPHSWPALSGDFHASLRQQPGPHIYGWRHNSCPKTANTTFVTSTAMHFRSDIQHCLNCRDAHSAQAFSCYNPFLTQLLFPSFLPSYKTCSIKVSSILAAIKPSWKPCGIFVLLSSFISNSIARI